MRLPDRETLEKLKARYPAGTRVRLIAMEDPQSPPPGTIGTVITVDGMGDLIMAWDNGRGLNVCPEVDRVAIVPDGWSEQVRAGILAVRDTGRTNMFLVPEVQRIAMELGYPDTVVWIEDHQREYCQFILQGDEGLESKD